MSFFLKYFCIFVISSRNFQKKIECRYQKLRFIAGAPYVHSTYLGVNYLFKECTFNIVSCFKALSILENRLKFSNFIKTWI
jgi:hypothetical protein